MKKHWRIGLHKLIIYNISQEAYFIFLDFAIYYSDLYY